MSVTLNNAYEVKKCVGNYCTFFDENPIDYGLRGCFRPIRDYSQDSIRTANEVKMLMTEN